MAFVTVDLKVLRDQLSTQGVMCINQTCPFVLTVLYRQKDTQFMPPPLNRGVH